MALEVYNTIKRNIWYHKPTTSNILGIISEVAGIVKEQFTYSLNVRQWNDEPYRYRITLNTIIVFGDLVVGRMSIIPDLKELEA